MGKKSGPQAPTPPDPVATANAQTQTNKDTAITQANLNRINQITPEGTLTYNNIGKWEDGTPRYEQVVNYSPEQRALYDSNNRIAQALNGTAENAIGRVDSTLGRGFDFSNFRGQVLPEQVGLPNIRSNLPDAGGVQSTFGTGGPLTYSAGGDFNATSKSAADAVYSQLASRLDPQYTQMESDLRNRLINSGISENSEAFKREMDNFARSRTDAYNTAGRESVLTGLAAQNQGFNQSLDNATLNNNAQGQQFDQNYRAAAFGNAAQDQRFNQGVASTGFNNDAEIARSNIGYARASDTADRSNAIRDKEIQEATYLRNLPINDIAALLGTGGGVQAPNFSSVPQVGVDGTDLLGATYNSYNAKYQQYAQAQANRSQGLGSIFGLAGSIGAAAISDRRVKHSIKAISKLANGLTTYVFSYIGEKTRQFGVMAQEVLQVKPEAVGVIDNGVMYVDYRKLAL